MSLEDQGRSCAIDNQHLKTIIEQNPRQSFIEMSQLMGVSNIGKNQ